MNWHEINFGIYKLKGYSLPQLAFKDWNYFQWCMKECFKGNVLVQAQLVEHNLRYLKLPEHLRGTHCVQFLYDWQGKLSAVEVTEIKRLPPMPAKNEHRSPTLNLVLKTDGVGRQIVLAAFKKHWLNEKSITKKRLEELLAEPRSN